MNDFFTTEALRAALGSAAPSRVLAEAVTDSTNAAARRAFVAGLDTPALFAAAEQTAGRGRLGRQFLSPAGTGVYFSYFQPLAASPESVLHITCAAGVAVRRGILAATGCDTRIKWVNDLRLGARKVCGILAEAPVMGDRFGLIIGIGINLRPIAFPPELADIAGSLGNTDCRRVDLIAACVRELRALLALPAEVWLPEYRAYSCTLGTSVCILRDGAAVAEGIAEDIRPDGALLLRQPDGSLLPIASGEVSVRPWGSAPNLA